MRDALAHRGPDGAGTWISPDRRVGLGSRRLAIIDLSHAADQPIANEDGSSSSSTTARSTTTRRCGRSSSRSAATPSSRTIRTRDGRPRVRAVGGRVLAPVSRHVAFALWDERKRGLWLVREPRRDQAALLRPSTTAGSCFGSEIKALLLDRSRAGRRRRVALSLTSRSSACPRRARSFRGIRKLEAGCWLWVDADGGSKSAAGGMRGTRSSCCTACPSVRSKSGCSTSSASR